MNNIRLYGLNTCDTCRKARHFLDSLGISYTYIDIRKDATDDNGKLDPALVSHLFDQFQWETLLNKRSTTWRQLDESDKSGLNADKAKALITSHPTLLKRPVLDNGKELVVGFDQKAYEQLA